MLKLSASCDEFLFAEVAPLESGSRATEAARRQSFALERPQTGLQWRDTGCGLANVNFLLTMVYF